MLQLLPRLTQSRFAVYAGRCEDALVARHLDGIRICRELAANADRAAVSDCQTSTIAALKEMYASNQFGFASQKRSAYLVDNTWNVGQRARHRGALGKGVNRPRSMGATQLSRSL